MNPYLKLAALIAALVGSWAAVAIVIAYPLALFALGGVLALGAIWTTVRDGMPAIRAALSH